LGPSSGYIPWSTASSSCVIADLHFIVMADSGVACTTPISVPLEGPLYVGNILVQSYYSSESKPTQLLIILFVSSTARLGGRIGDLRILCRRILHRPESESR